MDASYDSNRSRDDGSQANTAVESEKHLHGETNHEKDIITGSQKDIETVPSIGHAAEKHLVRKLDFYIVPPVMLLYLVSYLDR
jgi:hypothetical protein